MLTFTSFSFDSVFTGLSMAGHLPFGFQLQSLANSNSKWLDSLSAQAYITPKQPHITNSFQQPSQQLSPIQFHLCNPALVSNSWRQHHNLNQAPPCLITIQPTQSQNHLTTVPFTVKNLSTKACLLQTRNHLTGSPHQNPCSSLPSPNLNPSFTASSFP